MKIGYDGFYARADLVGIGKYIQNLVNQVGKKGHQCVIFYPEKPKYPITGKNISSRILPTLNRYANEQYYIPKLIKEEKVDLYHAVGNMGVPLFCPVPAVLTVHDIIPLLYPNYFNYSKYKFLTEFSYHFRLKSSVAKAKKIIADSEYTKKTLIGKTGVKTEKVKVIFLGAPEVNKETDKLPKGLKPGEYVLNHGGIDVRKNLDKLIRAFAKLLKTENLKQKTDLKLVITGENGAMEGGLRKEIKILGISDKVIFPGYVDEKELWSLIRQASCICYPSLIEGFGGPVLEGFAGETPVITANTSSLIEVAGEGALLVDPEDEKEIAEAIIKVISDKETRDKLIEKGKERLKDFSWEKTGKETVDVYKEAV
jgi:glycosyltransferase involved in cell wall biosynthesis